MSNFYQYLSLYSSSFFFFNDTATTEIYTLSLHDALPICQHVRWLDRAGRAGGTGRAGDAREVEVHQQRLAVRTGDRHARHVRGPPVVSGVDHRVGHDGEQPVLELVA